GYPREERTWEPKRNVSNAPQVIEKFHRENPTAICTLADGECDCPTCAFPGIPLFNDPSFRSYAASLNHLPDHLFEIPEPHSDPK
ncbi:hypothetical protein J3R82DRAFT_6221, partial [Butyriboletus roseoflavus]